MKRADDLTLQKIPALLTQLRQHCPGLVEKKPGIFYFKQTAFLHFHDDAAGIFADVKLTDASFTRMRVSDAAEQNLLLMAVKQVLNLAPLKTKLNANTLRTP